MLLARCYDMLIIIALAIPILCILSLMGGLDVGLLVLFDGFLLSFGFAIAAIAIAVSSLCETSRRAILVTYVIVAGWTAIPFLIEMARNPGVGAVYWLAEWASPINRIILRSNPLFLFSRPVANLSGYTQILTATMLVNVSMGLVLLISGSMILRPSLRRTGLFGWGWTSWTLLLSKRSLLPRSACGDYPIVWKEWNVARTSIIFRIAIVAGALAIAIPLAGVAWNYAAPAYEELRANGYDSQGVTIAREQFNEFLRVTMVFLYILMALALAVLRDLHDLGEGEGHLDEPCRHAPGSGRDHHRQTAGGVRRHSLARPGLRVFPDVGHGRGIDPSAGRLLFGRLVDRSVVRGGSVGIAVLDGLSLVNAPAWHRRC